ncbi:hypothetical protein EVAR_70204_1 [Eumeta japonica]|uniref:Uncharacterized protein n=1 Tax=Eumeta variegata TaxID=151549 RepID=A0A4C1ZJW7_EUMVA|nr:hypothetical protein EVAR_70204_1 [Eumeta japonica]
MSSVRGLIRLRDERRAQRDAASAANTTASAQELKEEIRKEVVNMSCIGTPTPPEELPNPVEEIKIAIINNSASESSSEGADSTSNEDSDEESGDEKITNERVQSNSETVTANGNEFERDREQHRKPGQTGIRIKSVSDDRNQYRYQVSRETGTIEWSQSKLQGLRLIQEVDAADGGDEHWAGSGVADPQGSIVNDQNFIGHSKILKELLLGEAMGISDQKTGESMSVNEDTIFGGSKVNGKDSSGKSRKPLIEIIGDNKNLDDTLETEVARVGQAGGTAESARQQTDRTAHDKDEIRKTENISNINENAEDERKHVEDVCPLMLEASAYPTPLRNHNGKSFILALAKFRNLLDIVKAIRVSSRWRCDWRSVSSAGGAATATAKAREGRSVTHLSRF